MRTTGSHGPVVALALFAALAGACSAKPKPAVPTDAARSPEPAPRVIPVPAEKPAPPAPPEPAVEHLSSSLEELNRKGYLQDAFFDFDRYELTQSDRDALAKDADWLRKWGSVQVTIEGHCDERGTASYNMALGERRAQAARDYLVSLGVRADRLRVVSYGKEKLFASGHDERSWAENRRAHFLITAR